ncbi:hypothetical protein HOLleu_43330 [Holothuria leucospilota]|uniref:Uncharacterized protein n=2 Tax=Holothuria leucospilota TaxID=206669 RepID=A0A9Q1B9Q0_HOLLE|nr:hypothetical protein HOLleu_43480 [Holothuria leucospilota]KAJ8018591.1 hypothetical protein HOLleu_43330 [Holothuria leucospilota]
MFMQWPNCFEKIITYAEKQVDWKQLLHFSGNLENDWYQHSCIFGSCEENTAPFLLALGKQEDPEQVFVIIERQTVACRSLVKGLDLSFKLFCILDIDYPWECQNLWDFIQKFIYGLGKGKGREKSVPSVSLLINFLTPSEASC